MRDGKLVSYEALPVGHQGPQLNFWKYRQLHHFFKTNGHTIRDSSSPTPFERLSINEEPVPHMVSELYRLLGSAAPQLKPAYIRRWENDLGQELMDTQLTHLHYLTHSSSMDSKTQETNFKIMSRWYPVPADLARVSELCLPICVRTMLARLRTPRYTYSHMVGMPPNQTLLGRHTRPHKKYNRYRGSSLQCVFYCMSPRLHSANIKKMCCPTY